MDRTHTAPRLASANGACNKAESELALDTREALHFGTAHPRDARSTCAEHIGSDYNICLRSGRKKGDRVTEPAGLRALRSPGGGGRGASRLERALTVLRGHVDVQVQAVFVLVLNVGHERVQVGGEPHGQHVVQQRPLVQVLRADGRELRGVPDPGPRRRGLGGLKAPLSSGRRGVRDPQVLLHGAQNLIGQWCPQAPDFAVIGADDGVRCLAVDEGAPDGKGGDPQRDVRVRHDAHRREKQGDP